MTFKRTGDTVGLPGTDAPGDIAATHLVYVTGGSELTKVRPTDRGSRVLDEQRGRDWNSLVTLSPMQPQTVNVTKSMADDDGMVYLIGYGNQDSNQ